MEIDRSSLKNLYKPLKLSSFVFKKVIQAHNDVLETGFRTGNERVIVLDVQTGNLIEDKTELPNKVEFKVPLSQDDYITIHNHPNNTPPSPLDLHTFNDILHIKSSVIQCHDGTLYALEKTEFVKYDIDESRFTDAFDHILIDTKYNKHSFSEKLDIFVKQATNLFNWKYRMEK